MQDFRGRDQLCKGVFPEKSRRLHSWIYQQAGTLRGNRYFCGPCGDAEVTESLADDGNGVEIETKEIYPLMLLRLEPESGIN